MLDDVGRASYGYDGFRPALKPCVIGEKSGAHMWVRRILKNHPPSCSHTGLVRVRYSERTSSLATCVPQWSGVLSLEWSCKCENSRNVCAKPIFYL